MRITRAAIALVGAVVALAPHAWARGAPASGCPVASAGFYTYIPAPDWPSGGAEIAAYAVHPRQASTLYATNGQALMRTRDGGCAWEVSFELSLLPDLDKPVSSATSTIKLVAVPEAAHGASIVYLLVEERLSPGSPVARPHVFVSADSGRSWRSASKGLPAVSGPAVALEAAPSDPKTAYVVVREPGSSGDAVYATNDAGESWQRRSPPGDGVVSIGFAIDPLDADDLWFWGPHGLHHSVDGGRTRALIDRVAPPVALFDIFHAPGKPARLMAYEAEVQSFARSDDGGATWYVEYAPPGPPLSMTHANRSVDMVMSVHGGVFRFVPPSYWIPIAPRRIPDLLDLQADRTIGPAVFGNARSGIVKYTGLGYEVEIPDVRVDGFPEIDPGKARLSPAETTLRLGAGKEREVTYWLRLPAHPTGLDVLFLVDTTQSMQSTINGLRHGMRQIVEELAGLRIDVQFGVADYKDYPLAGYGSPINGDYPYRLRRDIGPPDDSLTDALEDLQASGGGDIPESQLTALYQAATGSGDPGFVSSGQGATFRPRALPVIVHMTDAPFHQEIVYPAPRFSDVAAQIESKEIVHIGLGVFGPNGSAAAMRDLGAMSEATGSVAPTPIDCDGDGVIDRETGEPLVCEIRDEARRGVLELAPAIISTLKAVTAEVPVKLRVASGNGIVRHIDPELYPDVDIKEDNRVGFDVTFSCPRAAKASSRTVRLIAEVLRAPVADATAEIRCAPIAAGARPPRRPDEETLVLPPLIAPAEPLPAFVPVPLGPPPPIPEPVQAPQPHSQAAVAEQKQEQPQLAAVEIGRRAEEQYAFAEYSHRRAAVPREAVYTLAGAMALAYAFASLARSKARTALQRSSLRR